MLAGVGLRAFVVEHSETWRNVCGNILLCEGASSSRLTLRKAGQVELCGETPNGLSASATLANGDRECQYDYYESRIGVP